MSRRRIVRQPVIVAFNGREHDRIAWVQIDVRELSSHELALWLRDLFAIARHTLAHLHICAIRAELAWRRTL